MLTGDSEPARALARDVRAICRETDLVVQLGGGLRSEDDVRDAVAALTEGDRFERVHTVQAVREDGVTAASIESHVCMLVPRNEKDASLTF